MVLGVVAKRPLESTFEKQSKQMKWTTLILLNAYYDNRNEVTRQIQRIGQSQLIKEYVIDIRSS